MAGQPKKRAREAAERERLEAEASKQELAELEKKADELAKKRKQAVELNRYKPAVIHTGGGEVKTFTDAEIEAMTSTECDAVIANIIQRRSVGGRAHYPNVESLERKITEYWNYVFTERSKGRDVIPDIEHFCTFLGTSRRTVLDWKRDNKNGFGETLEMAFNDIAAVKNQLALHGEINPMVWMAMMNNNHGYTQNAKVEVTSKSTDSVPSSEALITEIHQLLDEE